MAQPKISIILVNYNGERFNLPCIDSILKQSYQSFEIIFIDNNSSDNSVPIVENKYISEISSGKLRIYKNTHNIWFSPANNQWHLLASSECKYIRLLNNDTVVHHDTLEKMVHNIENHNDLGAISCLILDRWHEQEIQNLYSAWNVITINYFWESIIKKVSQQEIESWLYYTSSLSGCSCLYKKDIINKPFPEPYFAYWEDGWISMHILSMWYTLAVDVTTGVDHYWSGSFGKDASVFKVFHGTKNQWMNLLSFYSWKVTWLLIPLFLITQLAQLFLNNPLLRIKGKWKAICRLYKNRQIVKSQRAYTQSYIKIPQKQLLKQLSNKCTDNIYFWNFSRLQLTVIKCLNAVFSIYTTILRIPHQ